MSNASLTDQFSGLNSGKPVLITGPTACGKSDLAMLIAKRFGGVVINADAIQVYGAFRKLTARPSELEEQSVPHHLYGHVGYDQTYSVGEWLRALAPLLAANRRPIITGGTGLYFQALTTGLVQIPPIDSAIISRSKQLLDEQGHQVMAEQLDAETFEKIDLRNPMRVQRAWQVLHGTGQGLAAWQNVKPSPLLALNETVPILFDVDRDWLCRRIEHRFEKMLYTGALEEVRAILPYWHPDLPCAKAIGAPQLVAYLRNEISLATAKRQATIATQQFAKRQRTWFRSKMAKWIIYHRNHNDKDTF